MLKSVEKRDAINNKKCLFILDIVRLRRSIIVRKG